MNSGDIIVCIDNTDSLLVFRKEYIVDRTFENMVCLVNYNSTSYKAVYFLKERFKTLEEFRNDTIDKILT